jgi:predicted lipoprotein with Yx(FWY)xxD motif
LVRLKAALAAMLLASLVGVAACGGGRNAGPAPTTAPAQGSAKVIKTANVKGLGTVLVNSDGYVLYMFPPDRRTKVTCTGTCAASWPPATVPDGTEPKAGPGVRGSLIATVPNPNPEGGRVVTYNGWPLYTYAPDIRPGMASGQALDLNGGFWYVMRPSGQIVKTTPTAGPG